MTTTDLDALLDQPVLILRGGHPHAVRVHQTTIPIGEFGRIAQQVVALREQVAPLMAAVVAWERAEKSGSDEDTDAARAALQLAYATLLRAGLVP